MKITLSPRLSLYAAAAGYPEQYSHIQHIFSTIISSHNSACTESGCFFQGFLIFVSANFISKARKELRNTFYSTRRLIHHLGQLTSHKWNGYSICSAFWYKRMPRGWRQCYTSREPAQGSPLLAHSPDVAYWSAVSLHSPVRALKTSAPQIFLVGRWSQNCFCSLRCSEQAAKVQVTRLPTSQGGSSCSVHTCSHWILFCIQHISSLPLTLPCQSSAPISTSSPSQCFWTLILIFLPESLSQLCHGLQAAIHFYHYKSYTRLGKEALLVS